MNAHNQEQLTPTYEDLLDIIEAQNFLISELQTENIKLLSEKEKLLSVPPVIENGVVVKLGRSFYWCLTESLNYPSKFGRLVGKPSINTCKMNKKGYTVRVYPKTWMATL